MRLGFQRTGLGTTGSSLEGLRPHLCVISSSCMHFIHVIFYRPLPETVWSKDGHPVRLSERVTQGNYGKSLIIKHANSDDEGDYTCEVSNGVGEAKTYTINLRVLGKSLCSVISELNDTEFEEIKFLIAFFEIDLY